MTFQKFFVCIVLVVVGCSKPGTVLHIAAPNTQNLTTESVVMVRGYQIGTVDEIRLDRDNNIGIDISITEQVELPIDSRFTVVKSSFFGSYQLSIEPGNSETSLSNGDTVQLSDFVVDETDSSIVEIIELLENVTGSEQRDSILYELRRLNENLEGGKSIK